MREQGNLLPLALLTLMLIPLLILHRARAATCYHELVTLIGATPLEKPVPKRSRAVSGILFKAPFGAVWSFIWACCCQHALATLPEGPTRAASSMLP
jgi:hypothetical protein